MVIIIGASLASLAPSVAIHHFVAALVVVVVVVICLANSFESA